MVWEGQLQPPLDMFLQIISLLSIASNIKLQIPLKRRKKYPFQSSLLKMRKWRKFQKNSNIIFSEDDINIKLALWKYVCYIIFFSINLLRNDKKLSVTVQRKSEYQQKVLKFKKTSPISLNLFIESRFWNGSTAPLATISVSKRFHSERI